MKLTNSIAILTASLIGFLAHTPAEAAGLRLLGFEISGGPNVIWQL